MTATEMFEELGFKKYAYGLIKIEYRKQISLTSERRILRSRIIKFDLERKKIVSLDSNCRVVGIDLYELKAINQQCKELGWFDE